MLTVLQLEDALAEGPDVIVHNADLKSNLEIKDLETLLPGTPALPLSKRPPKRRGADSSPESGEEQRGRAGGPGD